MAYLTAFADNFLHTTVQQVSTFCSLSNHMFHQTKDDRVSLEIMGKLSVHLTFTAFGLYLDPTWAATLVKNEKKKSQSNTLNSDRPPLHTQGTQTRSHRLWHTLFYYDGLVRRTSRQYPIAHFPAKCFSLLMLHPELGRKGHTIKWLRPSVHVIEWWCITPGWLYVYLTHCEHEYDFRDH